jgi:hypothetical protein
LGAIWALAVVAPAAVRAQTPQTVREQLALFHRDWVAAGKPAAASATRKWGVDHPDAYNVHAYDFQANTSTDLVLDDGNGYRYFGAPSVPYMAAPVRLPAGVHIGALTISKCSAVAGDLVYALYDNLGGGAGGGGGNLVAGPYTAGSGCTWEAHSADYFYETTNSHPLYLVIYFAGDWWDGATKFNSVGVTYRRVVGSFQKGGQLFDDVPFSDFGYNHIAALYYSGITGGCGGDDFCPDSPVTRRQMAIFIARALGLNWPD